MLFDEVQQRHDLVGANATGSRESISSWWVGSELRNLVRLRPLKSREHRREDPWVR
jgi:hypothetical protein